jgi:hypothetical protein
MSAGKLRLPLVWDELGHGGWIGELWYEADIGELGYVTLEERYRGWVLRTNDGTLHLEGTTDLPSAQRAAEEWAGAQVAALFSRLQIDGDAKP